MFKKRDFFSYRIHFLTKHIFKTIRTYVGLMTGLVWSTFSNKSNTRCIPQSAKKEFSFMNKSKKKELCFKRKIERKQLLRSGVVWARDDKKRIRFKKKG